MVARIHSATIIGVDAHLVEIETQVIGSTKRFAIIGLPDGVVKESKDRIRLAIENSGFAFPNREVVVSLGPATVPKRGAGFDLPIALSILSASGYIDPNSLEKLLAMAELALDGRLKNVSGCLAASELLRGRQSLLVAKTENNYSRLPSERRILLGANLSQVVVHLKGTPLLVSPSISRADSLDNSSCSRFSEVLGQAAAKRALEISAAGGHNSLLVGPPGAGKTMLASRLCSLLPPLSVSEELEVRKIYDSANMEIEDRPFRAPHHTTSYAGLIGGGSIPAPGEITLAHKGCSF